MAKYQKIQRVCFDSDIAEKFGVNAAILLENLHFWIEHNRANDEGIHDGRTWTYESMEAYASQFSFMTTRQVRTALTKLKDEGVIMTGCFNNSAFNRKTWYTLTDYGESFFMVARKSDDESVTFDLTSKSNLDLTQESAPFDSEVKSSIKIEKGNKEKEEGTHQPKPTKSKYGEFGNVRLTADEHGSLEFEYGEIETQEAIRYLDEYIEEKGTKYKSHYMALRRWVYDAVREKKAKKGSRKPGGGYDWDNL